MIAPLRQVVRRKRTGPGQQYTVVLGCGHSLAGLYLDDAIVAAKRCAECAAQGRDLVGLVRSARRILELQYAGREDRAQSFEAFAAAQLVGSGLTAPDTDVAAVVREALGEEAAVGA